jgi:hypothetical protein
MENFNKKYTFYLGTKLMTEIYIYMIIVELAQLNYFQKIIKKNELYFYVLY